MSSTPEYDLARYEAKNDQYDFWLEEWNSRYKPGKTCPFCHSKKITLDDDGYFCESCKSVWEPGEDMTSTRDAWIKKMIKEAKRDV